MDIVPDKLRPYWLPAALVVVYGVAVGSMWFVVAARERPTVEFRAARDLPPNTRIRREDVVRHPKELPPGFFWRLPDFDAELKGRYVVSKVDADKRVDPAALASAPRRPPNGVTTLTVPIEQAGLQELVNAGVPVRLCVAATCIPATTFSIVCDKEEKSCHGTFAVAETDVAQLKGAKVAAILVAGSPAEENRMEPAWKVIKELKVPGAEGQRWTLALDYVAPGKLYKIEVKADTGGAEQRWQPDTAADKCTADGDPELVRANPAAPMADVAVGALIARIGGSTADGSGDTGKTSLFSIGRHCVFQSDAAKVGSLFLGVNDNAKSAPKLKGQLTVSISEAL